MRQIRQISQMKQLDVDVSPPANIINLILGRMCQVTFACKLFSLIKAKGAEAGVVGASIFP